MAIQTVDDIGVVSLAKVVGTIGLLWGIIVSVVWIGTALMGGPFPGSPELVAATIGSLVAGIIIGAVTAILYNAAASLIGGLEFEVSEATH